MLNKSDGSDLPTRTRNDSLESVWNRWYCETDWLMPLSKSASRSWKRGAFPADDLLAVLESQPGNCRRALKAISLGGRGGVGFPYLSVREFPLLSLVLSASETRSRLVTIGGNYFIAFFFWPISHPRLSGRDGQKNAIPYSGLCALLIHRALALYLIMELTIQTVLKLLEPIPQEYRESAFPLLLNHALTMDRWLTFIIKKSAWKNN